MLIQINGTNTINKGAELMLYAILQEIEGRYPEAIVRYVGNCVPKNYFRTNLKILYPSFLNKVDEIFHLRGIIRRICKIDLSPKFIQRKDIDIVFDASGFCYSDIQHTSMPTAKALFSFIKKMKKRNGTVIILPQALGPFNTKATRVVLDAFEMADMVIARDLVSYNYLGAIPNKFVYPDFTVMVKGIIPKHYEHLKDYITIIPNNLVVNRKKQLESEYFNLIEMVIKMAELSRRNVFILNHESIKDMNLCKEISRRYGVEIISGLNSLEIKGFISRSYATLSSRYHGIVNSLNSMVPCLATSWSFKYDSLFKEYGLHDCILNLTDKDGNLEKIKKLLDESTNKKTRDLLRIKYNLNCMKTEKMWQEVWAHCVK